ncbi:type II toxin-antitoxin system HicB family antitoxin [Rodentibacter haemolyticus]|uniref:Type II toxin-antitoxin system HicB family antitoxin n=1 Tax=Rodentibacter haemolyticus TaxID=2778911 RepID=A0ABX6V475_9PAST|nr:type II toxin-antitoxin system HicB family antitoxin [Rodentibacter haemolyticus]QPB43056.1 type II toxin-antitoxin system HicB family antitoxin [Rodentibacter haemolyticus]
MLYPICMEKVSDGYVVSVPDVPGCFSAGDNMEEAILNTKEAIAFHIEGMLEDGEELPKSKPAEQYINDPEYHGFIVTVVDVDLAHLMGKAEKINITLPSLLLHRIDQFVATHPEYKNRSNFLAQLATNKLLTA